jgi:hypothetical protein
VTKITNSRIKKNLFSHRKRDDAMKININKSLAVSEWENDTLEMTSVSRVDIGAYLCIASVSTILFNEYNQLYCMFTSVI